MNAESRGLIADKASVYAYQINRSHPFLEGNKRTGMISALFFLAKNGSLAHPTGDEIVDLALSIATGGVDREEVAKAFANWILRSPAG